MGYGAAKGQLTDAIVQLTLPYRERYEHIQANWSEVESKLTTDTAIMQARFATVYAQVKGVFGC
jgi:23S rRNA C2498 (ribose-2'-O)-methylase RlmM